MDPTVKTPDANDSVTEPAGAPRELQPFLHDRVLTLGAPSFAVSRPDGTLRDGADGFYHGDTRALSRLEVTVAGIPLAPVSGLLAGDGGARFRAIPRGLGEVTADPAVEVRRRRTVSPGLLTEEITVVNSGGREVQAGLRVTAAADFAPLESVKSGRAVAAAVPRAVEGGLAWSDDAGTAVELRAEPAPAVYPAVGRLSWELDLPPGASRSVTITCRAAHRDGDQFPPPPAGGPPWSRPVLRSADRRFDHWLRQSLTDLDALRLTDPDGGPDTGGPDTGGAPAGRGRPDQFLAAGAPWFLTLFGRDSLIAARMLLPLGTELAAGTLRVLARRQGTVTDPATEEQPGKILHEVRRAAQHFDEGFTLPPLYYGTVDATPLWITLLHDAWRWGLDAGEVEPLLPNLEAALGWMRDHAGVAESGFLRYVDATGTGLANQGWKDSGDSIRYRDGRLAEPPIALCEVQAYAYEAALGGAALLRAFGRPGADAWEEWAQALAERFRARFWVEDARGAYPAVALDRDGRPADSVTSGFGHLLGTGLLNAEESAHLAARLGSPDLDSGHGLRTLSSDAAGFNPFGYHTGSVWPHDTAIAVRGLAIAGFPEVAGSLADGLLTASAAFAGRLPELFAGHGAAAGPEPAPYPASCRPQAWAAASSVAVLTSALGLAADVPGGTLTLAPGFADRYGPLTATGLTVAGRPLTASVDAAGTVRTDTPAALTVQHR